MQDWNSRRGRQDKPFTKKRLKALPEIIHVFLVLILSLQIIFLPISQTVFAADGDPQEQESQGDENNENEQPAPVESEGTSFGGIAPELEELFKEVEAGEIRPADPNHTTDQDLEIVDQPGRLTKMWRWMRRAPTVKPTEILSLKTANIGKPPVIIKDFAGQVEISFDHHINQLAFSALKGTVRHVRNHVDLAAPVISDPELILVPTRLKSRVEGLSKYQLDLVPVDEFIGAEGQPALGFNAPVNFYPALTFLLPDNQPLEHVEFFGPQMKLDRSELETLEGTEVPQMLKAGDLILSVGNRDKKIWVNRDLIYLNLRECIKQTAILTFLRAPTPKAYQALLSIFEGEEQELASAVELVRSKVDADGSWLLDHALSAQLNQGSSLWQVNNAKRLVERDGKGKEKVTPSALETRANAPRQEFDLADSDGTWEVLRQRLEEAVTADPTVEIRATTASYAQVAIKTAIETDRQLAHQRWSYWKRFRTKTSQFLTPGKMILLGLTLAMTGFAARPDSEPFPFLTALGSRIYQYAANDGVLPFVVRTATTPVKNASHFLSQHALQGSEGLTTMASWGGTLAFFICLLPLVYLVDHYVYHRFWLGENTKRGWWPKIQNALSDFLKVSAVINRSLHEGIWKLPFLRQHNLYPALLSGVDPLNVVKNRRAWNAPWASQSTLAENRRLLNEAQDRPRQLQLIASRAVALALVARETGVDPATLDMSGSAEDMTVFLEKLVRDPATVGQWHKTTQQLVVILDEISRKNPDLITIDPTATEEMVKTYVAQANRLLHAAETADKTQPFPELCETATSECRFSVTGFLKSLTTNFAGWTSRHVLHWALFGLPGVRKYHELKGLKMNMNATKMAGRMIQADYPLGAGVWAGNAPEAWSAFAPRVAAGQIEQIFAWNLTIQPDAMANALQAAKTSPYAPLNSYFFDPDERGPYVRHQTLDESIAAILASRTDPKSKNLFRYWGTYLGNVYTFLQSRLFITGVPLAIGAGITYWKKGEFQQVGELSAWPSIAAAAALAAAWVWFVKYTFDITPNAGGGYTAAPNYAVPWSAVNMFSNDVEKPVGENVQTIKTVVSLLSSSQAAHYQEGAKQLKALIQSSRLPIPIKFNIPSTEYTKSLADELLVWLMDPSHIPLPTKPNGLMTIGLINIGLGAVGTSALYDALNKQVTDTSADPVVSAAVALGWYLGTLAAVKGAAVVSEKVAPIWKPVHWATDGALNFVSGTRDLVKRGCGNLLMQNDDKTYEINLE